MICQEYQKLCLSIVYLSNYCKEHECNPNCDLFSGVQCVLFHEPPNKWHVPKRVLEQMESKEEC